MKQEVQVDAALPRRHRPDGRASRTAAGRSSDVTYATLNVQGSCNNLCDTAPNPAEYAARNAADIAWLDQTFDEAIADGLGGGHADHARPTSASTAPTARARRCATRRRSPRRTRTPARSTASSRSWSRCGHGRSPSASPSCSSTATRTTSASTSRSRTRSGRRARELHARRDVRRQRGQRPQRRAVGQGARRPEEPRRVRVPAADRAGEPRRRSRSVARPPLEARVPNPGLSPQFAKSTSAIVAAPSAMPTPSRTSGEPLVEPREVAAVDGALDHAHADVGDEHEAEPEHAVGRARRPGRASSSRRRRRGRPCRAPTHTASAVRPVRHQARYVRSLASRVRLAASRVSASVKPGEKRR